MKASVITLIENILFNVSQIRKDIENFIYGSSSFDLQKFNSVNQISLREGEGWFDGVGSLYDRKTGKFIDDTRQYTRTKAELNNTYLEQVINQVEEIGKQEGVGIGRVRIMRLLPKTCLTLHIDPDEYRYHIPIQTNYKCFFVSGLSIERMPLVGRLYKFRTNAEHTAVNASFEPRTHIVFDTFKI